jgi:hypothetical protein
MVNPLGIIDPLGTVNPLGIIDPLGMMKHGAVVTVDAIMPAF